jgi:hypothetical protein
VRLTTQLVLGRLLNLNSLDAIDICCLKPLVRRVPQILFVQLSSRDRLLERISDWHDEDMIFVVKLCNHVGEEEFEVCDQYIWVGGMRQCRENGRRRRGVNAGTESGDKSASHTIRLILPISDWLTINLFYPFTASPAYAIYVAPKHR